MAKSFEVSNVVPTSVVANKGGGNAALGIKVSATIKNTSDITATFTHGDPTASVVTAADVDSAVSTAFGATVDNKDLSNVIQYSTNPISLSQEIMDVDDLRRLSIPYLTENRYGNFDGSKLKFFNAENDLWIIYISFGDVNGTIDYRSGASFQPTTWTVSPGTPWIFDGTNIVQKVIGGSVTFKEGVAIDPSIFLPSIKGLVNFSAIYNYNRKVCFSRYPSAGGTRSELENRLLVNDYTKLSGFSETGATLGFFVGFKQSDVEAKIGFSFDPSEAYFEFYNKQAYALRGGSRESISISSSGVSWLNNYGPSTVSSEVTTQLSINDGALSSINAGPTGPYTLVFSESTAEAPDVEIPLDLNLIEASENFEVVDIDTPVKINRNDADCFYTRAKLKNTSTGDIDATHGTHTASYLGATSLQTAVETLWGYSLSNNDIYSAGITYSAATLATGKSIPIEVLSQLTSPLMGAISSGEFTPYTFDTNYWGYYIPVGDTAVPDRPLLNQNPSDASGVMEIKNGATTSSSKTPWISIHDPNNTLGDNPADVLDVFYFGYSSSRVLTADILRDGHVVDSTEQRFRRNPLTGEISIRLINVLTSTNAYQGYPVAFLLYSSVALDPTVRIRLYDNQPFTYEVGDSVSNVTVDTSDVPWLIDSTSPVIAPGEERGMLIPVDSANLPVPDSDTDTLTFTSQGSAIVKTGNVVLDINANYKKGITCNLAASIVVSQFNPERWFWAEGNTTATASAKVEITDLSLGAVSNTYGDVYATGAHQLASKPTTWGSMVNHWLDQDIYDNLALTKGTIANGEIIPASLSDVNGAELEDYVGFVVNISPAVANDDWPRGYIDNVFTSGELATGVTIFDPDDALNREITSGIPKTYGPSTGYSAIIEAFSSEVTDLDVALPANVASVGDNPVLVDGTEHEFSFRRFTTGTVAAATSFVFAVHKNFVTPNTRFRLYNQQPRTVEYGAPGNKAVTVTVSNPGLWLDLSSTASFTLTGGSTAEVDFDIDAIYAGGLADAKYTEDVVINVDSVDYTRSMELNVLPVSEMFSVNPNEGLVWTIMKNAPSSLAPPGDSTHDVNYSSDGVPTLTDNSADFFSNESNVLELLQAKWDAGVVDASVSKGTFKNNGPDAGKIVGVVSGTSTRVTINFPVSADQGALTGTFYFSTGVPEGSTANHPALVINGQTKIPGDSPDIDIIGDSLDFGKVYAINNLPAGTPLTAKIDWQNSYDPNKQVSDYFIKVWDSQPPFMTEVAQPDPTITLSKDQSWITLATSDGFTIS